MALALHGGAGAIRPGLLNPQRIQEYESGLRDALTIGRELLASGSSAIEAVCETVARLEDCPLFNAGHGAVFTANESIELDASIMCGKTRSAGAIAAVKTIKNPIRGARLVMERSPHVFLVGEGAEEYAALHGMDIVPSSYFETEKRRQQLHRFKAEKRIDLDHNDDAPRDYAPPVNLGTVGAVALDKFGNLAAATSTGGMTNKEYGRVGDSPIIGAGTWASNDTCAISCTGQGEYFLIGAVAKDVDARMRYGRTSFSDACIQALTEHVANSNGQGGLIAISRQGEILMPFNSLGMYRGCWSERTGVSRVNIWPQKE